MTLKDESPRLVGAQNATGEEWRNNSRKNEEMEPKRKQLPVVDVTGDGDKTQCCKEQYSIETRADSLLLRQHTLTPGPPFLCPGLTPSLPSPAHPSPSSSLCPISRPRAAEHRPRSTRPGARPPPGTHPRSPCGSSAGASPGGRRIRSRPWC